MAFSLLYNVSFATCNFDPDRGDTIGWSLGDCISDTTLVDAQDVNIAETGGFNNKIVAWIQNLGIVFSIFAISTIVMWAFGMVASAGDEEKIKKGKEKIKWGIVWFLAIISAGAIVSLVVNIMFAT